MADADPPTGAARGGPAPGGPDATAGEAPAAGLPWAAGSATGVGSLPGTDPQEAVRFVLGELPDLPFLPELPSRGPAGDLVGRTSALLSGLSVDLQPSGWRLVDRPSRDEHRAADALARDLDALEEVAQAGAPALLKVQSAGPWTLAASLELTRGEHALADAGAVRDLTASLAEGIAAHLAELRRRLPGTRLLLQLDEPLLPAVLLGRVPTSSGFGTLRAAQPPRVADGLGEVLAVADSPIVHCCAPHPPVRLLVRAGARSLSLDATLLREVDDDALGEAVEQGVGLLAGCVPAVDAPLEPVHRVLTPVRRLWQRLGLPADDLPRTVVITPTCGLAGASQGYAEQALVHCVRAGAALREEPL